jgi:hypothetical protein
MANKTLKRQIKKLSNNRKWVVFWLIFFYPFGVYLMWKGKQFNPDLRWMISFVWLLAVLIFPKSQPEEVALDSVNGGCSKTIVADGCTYYRDNNCKVISQSCEE